MSHPCHLLFLFIFSKKEKKDLFVQSKSHQLQQQRNEFKRKEAKFSSTFLSLTFFFFFKKNNKSNKKLQEYREAKKVFLFSAFPLQQAAVANKYK